MDAKETLELWRDAREHFETGDLQHKEGECIAALRTLWDALSETLAAKFALEAQVAETEKELAEGDYWMMRAKDFAANGGCPSCFASDEAGHKDGCEVAALEAQVAAMRKAGGKLADRLIGLHKPLVGRPIDRELADWRKAAGG